MTRSVRAVRQAASGAGWTDLLLGVARQVRDDNVSLLSAGVAFYAMLSAFPALIAVISIYGLVAEPGTARAQVQKLAGVMPGEARQALTGQLEALTHGAGNGLSVGAVLGILVAVLAASAGMRAMIASLNVAYDCRTYGVIGAVIVLLIWLFLTSFAVLVGAELNNELELRAGQAGGGPAGTAGERVGLPGDRVTASPPGAPGR